MSRWILNRQPLEYESIDWSFSFDGRDINLSCNLKVFCIKRMSLKWGTPELTRPTNDTGKKDEHKRVFSPFPQVFTVIETYAYSC